MKLNNLKIETFCELAHACSNYKKIIRGYEGRAWKTFFDSLEDEISTSSYSYYKTRGCQVEEFLTEIISEHLSASSLLKNPRIGILYKTVRMKETWNYKLVKLPWNEAKKNLQQFIDEFLEYKKREKIAREYIETAVGIMTGKTQFSKRDKEEIGHGILAVQDMIYDMTTEDFLK